MRIPIGRFAMAVWPAISLGLIGCGKTPVAAPVQSVSPTMPTAASPAQGAVKAKEGEKETSASTERKVTIPSNTDPQSLFTVGNPGSPMEIEGTRAVLPTDLFQVASADVLSDSTQFVVSQLPDPSKLAGSPVERKAGFVLPNGFEEVPQFGYSPEGYPRRIRCLKTGSQLAVVPAGNCIVGTDVGPEVSQPAITVYLDTFYLEVLEVTVQDFEKFRLEMREKKKTVPPAPSNPSDPDQTPALGVSWASAVAYARWAGMELPTEAEFEKATRGENGLRTPWGNGKPLVADRVLTMTGICAADRSPYGIFDLAGNASEWCADLYSPTAHEEASKSGTQDIPPNWPGPKKVRNMNLRVVKGNGENWNAWDREGRDLGRGFSDVGFRCALRISQDSKVTKTEKGAF